jgi:hypothetical protein
MEIKGTIPEHDWVSVTGPMFLKDADVIGRIMDEQGIPAKIAEPNPPRYSNFAPQLKTGQVLVPKHLHEKALAILKAREAAAER